MLSSILAGVTQRPFWSERHIREFVKNRNEARIRTVYAGASDGTTQRPLSDLRAMLLSFGDKQQTWLVADRTTAYCVQDDRKWEDPKLALSASLESMLPVEIKEDWSEHDGVVLFGNRAQMWLYSKELFLNDPPAQAITRFLSSPPAGSTIEG